MISGPLIAAGATNEGGRWTFNGNPITVKVLIRQDDVRKESMGQLIASESEKIGFSIQREYGDLNKANTVVYGLIQRICNGKYIQRRSRAPAHL